LKLKTYTAESYTEALKKVKEEVGDDAVIVSSKEIKKKTLTSPGLYEIVVAVEEDTIKPRKPMSDKTHVEEVMLKLSNAAKEISSTIETKKEVINKSNLKSSKNDGIIELKKEITKISDTLKFLQASMWEIANKNELELPPEFSEIYALSRASGMNEKHLDEIMKLTIKYMPLKMRKNSETIKRYFYTLLKKMIPIRIEREITPPHKKIMMFVGPVSYTHLTLPTIA
jgi:flagellar biosynthesis protein FlhF